MKNLLYIICGFLFSSSILFASTGTLPQKQFFIWEGFSVHSVTGLTNTDKTIIKIEPPTRGAGLNVKNKNPDSNRITFLRNLLYITYGITNDLSVFGGFFFQIPPVYNKNIDTKERDFYNNLGDFTLGLKWRFVNGIKNVPISFSLTGLVKFPLVQYSADSLYAVGDRQNDYGLRFAIGYKFSYWKKRITNSFSPWVKYTFRDGLPPDNISFGFEYRFLFPYNLHIKLYISHHRSIGGFKSSDSQYIEMLANEEYEIGILRSSLLSNYTLFGFSFEVGINNKVYLGVSYSFVFEGANTYIQHVVTTSIGIPIQL